MSDEEEKLNGKKVQEIYDQLYKSLTVYVSGSEFEESFEACKMLMSTMIISLSLSHGLNLEHFLDEVFSELADYAYSMEKQVIEKKKNLKKSEK